MTAGNLVLTMLHACLLLNRVGMLWASIGEVSWTVLPLILFHLKASNIGFRLRFPPGLLQHFTLYLNSPAAQFEHFSHLMASLNSALTILPFLDINPIGPCHLIPAFASPRAGIAGHFLRSGCEDKAVVLPSLNFSLFSCWIFFTEPRFQITQTPRLSHRHLARSLIGGIGRVGGKESFFRS